MMNTEQMTELENDLVALIGKHHEWIEAEHWQAACEAVGRGYFDEMAERGALADRFAEALTEALAG